MAESIVENTSASTPAADQAAPQNQPSDLTAPASEAAQGQYPPLPEPNLKGDSQGTQVSNYLRRRINEEQFDAFCIDCQENRSSHCNVTFGTFICASCAEKHEAVFSPHLCYIKPLFDDAWDTFQITCVQIGGNKRFYEFLSEYGKERDPINKKYDSSASSYYRKRLCAQAKNLPFAEKAPPTSALDFANKTVEKTNAWVNEANEKYKIGEKTSAAASSAKSAISDLWGRAKTLVTKKPNDEQPAAAQAASTASEQNADVVEAMEDAKEEAKAE